MIGEPKVYTTKAEGMDISFSEVVSGNWPRNLDRSSPYFEKQQEYVIQTLEHALTLVLITHYSTINKLRIQDELAQDLGVKTSEIPGETDAILKLIKDKLKGKEQYGKILNKYPRSLLDECDSRFVSALWHHFNLNPLEMLPLPEFLEDSVRKTSGVISFIRLKGWHNEFQVYYPAVIVGPPGVGKSTLVAKLVDPSSKIVVMPDAANKKITNLPNLMIYTHADKRREIQFTGQYVRQIKLDTQQLAALEPAIEETSELTNFERLLIYTLLSVTREHTYDSEVQNSIVDSRGHHGVTQIGSIFNVVCLICASAGLDYIPHSILRLLDHYPWLPERIIELRPNESTRRRWIEEDHANSIKRAEALAVDGNLGGCFRSLQDYYEFKYVVINPEEPSSVQDVKNIILGQSSSDVPENQFQKLSHIALSHLSGAAYIFQEEKGVDLFMAGEGELVAKITEIFTKEPQEEISRLQLVCLESIAKFYNVLKSEPSNFFQLAANLFDDRPANTEWILYFRNLQKITLLLIAPDKYPENTYDYAAFQEAIEQEYERMKKERPHDSQRITLNNELATVHEALNSPTPFHHLFLFSATEENTQAIKDIVYRNKKKPRPAPSPA